MQTPKPFAQASNMAGFAKPQPNNKLQRSFDERIDDFISKLEADRTKSKRPPARRLTVSEIYDQIKVSPTPLARNKRRPLEDAIERVLKFRKDEEEIRQAEEEFAQSEIASKLNNQIISGWNTTPITSTVVAATVPAISEPIMTSSTPGVINMNDDSDRPKKRRRSVSPPPPSIAPASGQTTPGRAAQTAVVSPADALVKKKSRTGRGYDSQTVTKQMHMGGVDELIDYVERYVFPDMPMERTRSHNRGFLLSGPAGCGKRTTVKYLAHKWEVPLLQLRNTTLLNVDKAEKVLNEAVEEAKRLAPCVVMFPNIHVLFGSSSAGSGDRLITMLLADALQQLNEAQVPQRPIAVIATTSSPDSIPKELMLSRSLSAKWQMKIPDVQHREQILKALSASKELPELDWADVARRTHGYVANDLHELITIAMVESLNNNREEAVVLEDVVKVIPSYTPSLLRQGFSTIPSITFDQVGGLGSVRKELYANIIRPITHPELYARFGITKPSGVLLWGPPGCGKTLVAQAVANAAQASFILIKGPELLDKYVGESERKIRELFTRARSCAPCLLFFDEMDSLVPRRENTSTEAGARVVNTFLAELDGGQDRNGVFVIATTNRPDMIDSAMLRPGRLDTRLFVDLPDETERIDILKTIFRGRTMYDYSEDDLALMETIARDKRCENFSGADLHQLHKHAVQHCLERVMEAEERMETTGQVDMRLTEEDWRAAMLKTTATVTDVAHLDYLRLAAEM